MKNHWLQHHEDKISLQRFTEQGCDLTRYYDYQYIQNEEVCPTKRTLSFIRFSPGVATFSLKRKYIAQGTLTGTLYVNDKPLAVFLEFLASVDRLVFRSVDDTTLPCPYADILSGELDAENGTFRIGIKSAFRDCHCVVNYEFDYGKDGRLPRS